MRTCGYCSSTPDQPVDSADDRMRCIPNLSSSASMAVPRSSWKSASHIRSFLRVLVRIRHDRVDYFLVQPRPCLPCSCKPENHSNNDHECENWQRIVEVLSGDRDVSWKTEDHHHPPCIDQCEDIDGNAVSSKRPVRTLHTAHQPSVEHAADGNCIGRLFKI
jgi:endogenous inhibitor of DNA gyrase (YacG/DUF329 family)